MYAKLSLVHEALKDVVEKKALGNAKMIEMVSYRITSHQTSQGRFINRFIGGIVKLKILI